MRAFQPSRSASMQRKGWAAQRWNSADPWRDWNRLAQSSVNSLHRERSLSAELEKETAKGLHFPAGHYAPIHRKGFLAAGVTAFKLITASKALRAIERRRIHTLPRFDPWLKYSCGRCSSSDVRID